MLKYEVQSNTRRGFRPIRFEHAWACEESCDTRMVNAWLTTVEEGDMLGLKKKINTLIRNLGVKEMELLNHKIMKGVKLILFGCFVINK